jgi:D-alanyl-D-alanine dipeptidase
MTLWRPPTALWTPLVGMLIPAVVTILATGAPRTAELPAGIVYLRDVAPTIRQDMRYASYHNFIGRPIDGYDAAECILSARAAQTLAAVQAEVAGRGLSLIVWDCYRPTRAVADFKRWSARPNDVVMQEEFYPNTDKARMFELGYLASRSSHSRASTVDLGLVPATLQAIPAWSGGPLVPCTAPKGTRFDDGTVDLGTGYDCLDERASFNHPKIGESARTNRTVLRDAMVRHGFKPYFREWWHFELSGEPFPRTFFDFPIASYPRH